VPDTSDLPLARWMRQYNSVRAGMSESEVEIILGAPDYARCDVTKQGDKFVGSTWLYAVVVPQDVANDSQNSGIQIVFGPDGKLTDKNAMNMQAKASATPTPSATATPVATPESSPAPIASPSPSAVLTPSPTPESVPSATATPSPPPQ
jgi:outer membrane protein assembly factor BamE (lipoprotein component of BamABCDE complex)